VSCATLQSAAYKTSLYEKIIVTMSYNFRKLRLQKSLKYGSISIKAIARRKEDGSNQWQDGYPNPDGIQNDIDKNAGFVLTEGDTIIGYSALLINDEPAYEKLEGQWLTSGDYVVFHRVAISESHLG
jgi:hypothetical protein